MTNMQQLTEPALQARRQALSVEALEGVAPALEEITAIETELRRRQIITERETLAAAERARRASQAREQERQRLIASLRQQLADLDAEASAAAAHHSECSSVAARAQWVFDLAAARADGLRGHLSSLTQDVALSRARYAAPANDVRPRLRQALASEEPAWRADLEALRALTPPAPEPFYER